MQSFPNIERSAFRPAEYVGYARGVWRIKRVVGYGWRAAPVDGTRDAFMRHTLEGVSAHLSTLAEA